MKFKINFGNFFLLNNFNYFSRESLNSLSSKFFFTRNIWYSQVSNSLNLINLSSFNFLSILNSFENSQLKCFFCFNHVFFKRLAYFKKFFIRKKRREKFYLTNKKLHNKLTTLRFFRFRKTYYLNKFFRFRKRLRRLHFFFLVFIHFFFTMYLLNFNSFLVNRVFALKKSVEMLRRKFLIFFLMGPAKRRILSFTSFYDLKNFFFEESFLKRTSELKLVSKFLKKKKKNFKVYMKPLFV